MNLNIFIKMIMFLCSMCALGYCVNSIIYYACAKKGKKAFIIGDLPLFFILGAGCYTFFETIFSINGVKINISHFVVLFTCFLAAKLIIHPLPAGEACPRRGRGGVRGLDDSNETPSSPSSPLWGEDDMENPTRKKKTFIFIVIIALTLILFLISLLLAMAFPQFDIDMLGHILIKAKIAVTETYKNCIYFHDDMLANLNNRHPPFVAMVFGLMFLLGCDTVSCYQIVNYFIFLLAGISIYCWLKKKIPQWQCAAWFFVFMSTRPYLASQYIIDSTDVLFSLNILLIAIWLIEYIQRKDTYSLIICSALAGISVLIKDEALVFVIFAAIILFFVNKPSVIKYLLILLLVSAPWLLYRWKLPVSLYGPEYAVLGAGIGNIKNINHIIPILFSVLFKRWNFAFAFWISAVIILLKSKFKVETAVLSAAVLFLIFVYSFVLTMQVGQTAIEEVGFFRLYCHAYPMVLVCIALAAGHLLDRRTKRA